MATHGEIRTRKCQRCSRVFETDQAHRRSCFVCSPQRLKIVGTPVIPEPEPEVVAGPHTPGRIERATIKELSDLDVLDTIEGALAESLARDLDNPNIPGAQRTSMSKQLRDTINDIRERFTSDEPDELDGFQQRLRDLREGM